MLSKVWVRPTFTWQDLKTFRFFVNKKEILYKQKHLVSQWLMYSMYLVSTALKFFSTGHLIESAKSEMLSSPVYSLFFCCCFFSNRQKWLVLFFLPNIICLSRSNCCLQKYFVFFFYLPMPGVSGGAYSHKGTKQDKYCKQI